jgi:beta-glucanase (GH16 family)
MRLQLVRFAVMALVYVAMATMLAGAEPATKEKQAGKEPAARDGWKLVWADEFDYTGVPNPEKWDYEVGYIRNNEAQYYTRARKENAWVEGGVLTITGRKEKFTIGPGGRGKQGQTEAQYTAASLTTRGKASWTFGRIELRAKLPKGRGVWPAFWTLGTSGGWPRGGEIDIMEYVGKDPNNVHSNLHFSIAGKHVSSGGTVKVANPWDEFHTYAVDWDSQRMDFSCDEAKYFSFDLSKADENGANPYRKPQYILLNLALGGGYGGPIDDANLPQKLVVDYVRVYQRAEK